MGWIQGDLLGFRFDPWPGSGEGGNRWVCLTWITGVPACKLKSWVKWVLFQGRTDHQSGYRRVNLRRPMRVPASCSARQAASEDPSPEIPICFGCSAGRCLPWRLLGQPPGVGGSPATTLAVGRDLCPPTASSGAKCPALHGAFRSLADSLRFLPNR